LVLGALQPLGLVGLKSQRGLVVRNGPLLAAGNDLRVRRGQVRIGPGRVGNAGDEGGATGDVVEDGLLLESTFGLSREQVGPGDGLLQRRFLGRELLVLQLCRVVRLVELVQAHAVGLYLADQLLSLGLQIGRRAGPASCA
jgi:hypothetical protein